VLLPDKVPVFNARIHPCGCTYGRSMASFTTENNATLQSAQSFNSEKTQPQNQVI